jgi:hypothetical protein
MKRNLLFLVVLSSSILLTACDDDDFYYFGGDGGAQFGNIFIENGIEYFPTSVGPQLHSNYNWIGIIAEDGQAHFYNWNDWNSDSGDTDVNHIVGEATACEDGDLYNDTCDVFWDNQDQAVSASIIDFDDDMYYAGYVSIYRSGNPGEDHFYGLGHFTLYPNVHDATLSEPNQWFYFNALGPHGYWSDSDAPDEMQAHDELYKRATKLEDLADRNLYGHSGDSHFGSYRLMTANEVIDGRLRFETYDNQYSCGGGSGYFYYIDTRFNPVGVYMDYNNCNESVNGDYKGVAFLYPPEEQVEMEAGSESFDEEECYRDIGDDQDHECEHLYWSLKGDTENGETRAWFAGFAEGSFED